MKDALWGGGGGTHRSWPGGRGGRPRALVAGEGWGGRRGDGKPQGWGLVGCSLGSGKGWLGGRGGCKGFGCGVGGRGTGPRDGANFATLFLTACTKEKWLSWVGTHQSSQRVREARGGCKGFGSREVGGRDTGPRDGVNFATYVVFFVVSNAYKK